MSYNHDWKTSMDELVAITSAAWFDTGHCTKSNGTSAFISLGNDEKKEEKEPDALA